MAWFGPRAPRSVCVCTGVCVFGSLAPLQELIDARRDDLIEEAMLRERRRLQARRVLFSPRLPSG